MRRLVLALAVFISLAAQETTLPKDHYCLAGPPLKTDPRGHECHCRLLCTHTLEGEHESSDCKLYCRRDRCACHPEEPCEKPPA